MKTSNRKIYIFVILFSLAGIWLFGAAPPPPPPPPCWPPPCIPIDGGVGFLIGAGVLYGVKKSYDKFKSRKNKETE